ncbi:uncharacterized protein LOC113352690 [Papaver somniferum]|uniref:uncharacterized protein LOC113352690 n=1 Tax=Papaver somniferum TaxID=3469 RepID=UPI000E6F7441|nr:uncharacterized protein LOC113352690 [Papaver somniferum]
MSTLPKNGCHLYYGEYDEQPNKKLKKLNQPSINYLSITGSHNGLICFADSNHSLNIHEPIHISNPITREFMNVPRLEVVGENRIDSMVCGFGYHPSVDKYKIVKIHYMKNQPLRQVQVYTLGDDSCSGWRGIGQTAYSLRLNNRCSCSGSRDIGEISLKFISDGFLCHRCPFGAFANGSLHWLNEEQKIVSFDLSNEMLCVLPSPPFVRASSVTDRFQLKVLGGCLCFIHHKPDDELLDIRFLRSKGESNSHGVNEQEYDLLTWIKEFSFPIEGDTDTEPFAVTKSGEVLLSHKSVICCYDPKTAAMDRIVDVNFCLAVPHMNTFVSLKALGEKCRSRKKYVVKFRPRSFFIKQKKE